MLQTMKIKTRILSILGILAGGYLLLLAMVQASAMITHSRMSQISSSLFPAALRMQEAEAAFERMKKHYGDAVVLQDAASLTGAEKDAEDTATALGAVKIALAAARSSKRRPTICWRSLHPSVPAIMLPMLRCLATKADQAMRRCLRWAL